MKKRIVLLLAAILAFGVLTACGQKEETKQTESKDTIQQAASSGGEAQTQTEPAGKEDTIFDIYALSDSTCKIEGCRSSAKVIVVPEQLEGKTVIGVATKGFSSMDVEKVVLPDTVEFLESKAFVNCAKLKQIDLGKGLKTVAESSFINLNALESLTFPDSLVKMEANCIEGCASLKETYIPGTLAEVPERFTYLKLNPNIVIVTAAGSEVERVAKENGLPVITR